MNEAGIGGNEATEEMEEFTPEADANVTVEETTTETEE